MTLTPKETMLLQDAQKQEQLCIDKYTKHAECAAGAKLKSMFTQFAQEEAQHLNSLTQLLNGTVPNVNTGTSPAKKIPASFKNDCPADQVEQTKYICSDSLATEKYVSQLYDTGIFEMCQPAVRDVLNHIQKEEQKHGEHIYRYMADNNIY